MPWIRINSDVATAAEIDLDVLTIPQVDLRAAVPCSRARRGCPDPARWATCPPCGHPVLGCDACRAFTDAAMAAELALGYTTTSCNTCSAPAVMPIPWREL
ncbi:hypothetical protein APR04_003780 [Promicromonospora umidemergens]|uniref:Uncharacterized protein n=1 Tax=Promicromonospora umidemergens TaxID=629679 RepID=A0ABP8XIB1_9MICO|nr:hypothetical protein [Promicromonospora umidemergens]MCP2284857.1 hypothetical protein [Promicromonospora umidemergens]